MKIKILILIIISFSIIIPIFSSYIFLHFINPNLDNIKTITKTKEIVIDEKFTTITNLENNITSLVKEVSPSVVNIIITKELTTYRRDPWGFFQEPIWSIERKVWWWSWFFIDENWIIITNKHVIWDPNSKYTIITHDNKEYEASVIALDPLTDLWVLKIDNRDKEKFKTLDIINNEEQINIWQFAIAIWYALWEFQNSVSLWVISWKNRSIEASDWSWTQRQKLSGLLQTDAAINPWNSWWPLINLAWEVVWINTAIAWSWQWVWFTIPLTQKRIEYILESIKNHWEIKRPFIWISYIPVNENIAKELWLKYDYWAYILNEPGSVVEWSSAYNKWIQPWDHILSIDWINITIQNDLVTQIQNKIPWDKVELEIIKNSWNEEIIEIILWEY